MNLQKNLRILFCISLLASCASLENEKEQIEIIRSKFNDNQYSWASYQIMAFEGKYPESEKMCELWGIQLKIYEIKNKSDEYIEGVKRKMKEKCL